MEYKGIKLGRYLAAVSVATILFLTPYETSAEARFRRRFREAAPVEIPLSPLENAEPKRDMYPDLFPSRLKNDTSQREYDTKKIDSKYKTDKKDKSKKQEDKKPEDEKTFMNFLELLLQSQGGHFKIK